MPLMAYQPDPKRYDDVFSFIQGGGNPMVRYRGSAYQNGSGFPQILKSLLAKLAAFAKPMLRATVPYAREAFEAAEPHLREATTIAVNDLSTKATEAISRRLSAQEGQGRKRRRAPATRRVKRLCRIPPKNLPDFI